MSSKKNNYYKSKMKNKEKNTGKKNCFEAKRIKSVFDYISDESSNDSKTNSEKELNDMEENVHSLKRKNEFSNSPERVKKLKQTNDLFKAPTVEELNQLRETENLFNSNLFRLQIIEILKELSIKETYINFFTHWFKQLKERILSLDDSEEYKLSDCKWINKFKLKVPFYLEIVDDKGVFKFIKPNSIQVTGLFNSDCAIGPSVIIDVNIEIPSKCFHKSDCFNARYLHKRALYLAYVLKELSKCDFIEAVHYTTYNGNILKPIIEMTPAGKISKSFKVQLRTTIEQSTFKLSKFSPSKNNIRPTSFLKDSINTSMNITTPFYNSVVLEDLTYLENEVIQHECLSNCSNIRDGLKLLQVWLKQRQLIDGFGGFNRNLLLMFVVYLIKKHKLNNAMSSYQVIRNVWINLANSNWSESGITLSSDANELKPSLEEFHKEYAVVFIDNTGFYNLASNLNVHIYQKVKHESKLALRYLDDNYCNGFQVLFMMKIPFYMQYDHILNVHDFTIFKQIIEKVSDGKKIGYLNFKLPLIIQELLSIINKGLNNRLFLLVPKLMYPKIWSPDEIPNFDEFCVTIGLSLNPDTAYSLIDVGPEANMPDAEEFKSFWGKKAELRRFADGSISEAVVWNGSTIYERRNICKQIISYLLKKYFNINCENSTSYFSNQFENILMLPNVKMSFEYGSGEEVALKIVKCFEELSHELRSLEGLPLIISSIQGTSSVLRFTDVYPNVATQFNSSKEAIKNNNLLLTESNLTSVPHYVHPIEGVIQLGISGKWPNDIVAVKHIKTAFYIEIADLLLKKYLLKSNVHPDYLQVYKNGWIFRFCIGHQKEIALLKKSVSSSGVISYKDTEESLELEKQVLHLPKITSSLHGLNIQNPSFGVASRIAKRWLRSQLLDKSHVHSLAIELLVASIYTSPEPYSVPQSPQCAFLRLLQRLSFTDWQIELVIVNFNNELNSQQIAEIETKFTQNRQSLPALFIATPYDTSSSLWTKSNPSKQVLLRMSLLAKESLQFIENKLYGIDTINEKIIFQPALSGYDAIIYLKSLNPLSYQSVDKKIKYEFVSYKKKYSEKIPVVKFNPVQIYLANLREHYGEYALFFHDSYGGHIIGVLWKPSAKEMRDFKVSQINGRRLITTAEDNKLTSNLEAILEDFYVIGQDLVLSIDVK